MGAWSSSWFRKKIKRKLRCQKEQARPQFSKYRLQNATDCVRQGQSGFLLYWSGYDRAINNIITLGQKTASWSGENRILQMERYEASRVGADTSCRYHRPSSTPSTATHSIIFANQYCVKLRVKASLTRIGQLDQQSCKLSLPYTSRPNYSFALFVVKTLGRMQEIKRSQCIENIQLWSILIRILSCLCCTITCMTYPAKTHPL